jgi:Binding-prot-dependent transport system membrane comp, N-term/Bacterial extracellular solute-binding proteins, family 5 Middle
MVPVLVIVSAIAFGLLYVLPGDPAVAILGENAGNRQTYLALRQELGLDQPLYAQYFNWLGRVLHGDLGKSIRTNEAVADILMRRVPISLYLGAAGLIVGIVLGLSVAVVYGSRVSLEVGIIAVAMALSVGVLAACQQPAPREAPSATAGLKPTLAPIQPATVGPTMAPVEATRAPAAAVAASPKRGGQLRILQTNDFVSMDPIHASGPTAFSCFDWLLAWRPNAQGQFGIQPRLATAWETSANSIVFRPRDNAKFHDGSDVNAEAVVWNSSAWSRIPRASRETTWPRSTRKSLLGCLGHSLCR